MEQVELKACPFCGGKAEIRVACTSRNHYVRCIRCRAIGPKSTYRDESAAIWNRRVNNGD